MRIHDINDRITAVLGKRLVAADARTYMVEGVDSELLDLAEVVLCFEPDDRLFFSWEQSGSDFDLSVRSSSHLLPDYAFGRGASTVQILLATLLSKPLTTFDLFSDQFGVVGVRLEFESLACGIAVGHEEWNEEKQTREFTLFGGDDLFLWSDEDFIAAVNTHGLRKVAGKSHATEP